MNLNWTEFFRSEEFNHSPLFDMCIWNSHNLELSIHRSQCDISHCHSVWWNQVHLVTIQSHSQIMQRQIWNKKIETCFHSNPPFCMLLFSLNLWDFMFWAAQSWLALCATMQWCQCSFCCILCRSLLLPSNLPPSQTWFWKLYEGAWRMDKALWNAQDHTVERAILCHWTKCSPRYGLWLVW